MTVLRGDLLQGRAVAVAPGVPAAVDAALARLGARVELLEFEKSPDHEVGDWARAHGPLDVLVYDATLSFGDGGQEGLLAAMQDAWVAIREMAVGELINSPRPSKIVLLGPRAGAGAFATATSAALENLARTLSVEWARYRIGVVLVARALQTGEQEVAELVCFLASPGADYLSGCRLELGASITRSAGRV